MALSFLTILLKVTSFASRPSLFLFSFKSGLIPPSFNHLNTQPVQGHVKH